jgi:integrase/recombinase XerD
MTSLTLRLDEYLAVRRGFGFDLAFTARVLRRFVQFADNEGATHVTVKLFLRWKANFGCANNNTWTSRLGMVRGFASWLQGIDPRTEIPPPGLIRGKLRRSRPYIYSTKQIAQIIAAAARLPSDYGLRGWTYSTFFGLLAVSGLRISEAIKLNDQDVNLTEALLTIKRGKNGKPRLVPIAPCTAQRLSAYRAERTRMFGAGHEAFFIAETGFRPTEWAARYNFVLACQRIGLRIREPFYKHGKGPRIHDLRHTFAVQTIIGWYRQGLDPDREMIKLSTYLGHSLPMHTYWYIEAVPELLQLASQRAERALATRGGAI